MCRLACSGVQIDNKSSEALTHQNQLLSEVNSFPFLALLGLSKSSRQTRDRVDLLEPATPGSTRNEAESENREGGGAGALVQILYRVRSYGYLRIILSCLETTVNRDTLLPHAFSYEFLLQSFPK